MSIALTCTNDKYVSSGFSVTMIRLLSNSHE